MSAPADRTDDAAAARIGAGYAFDAAAIELGAVVLDGEPHPGARVRVPLPMLNRHGLIAGVTGTGKTKTLQLIAEQLSRAGVPVVLADVKGDLTGLSKPGEPGDRLAQRARDTGDDWAPDACPVEFLSVGGAGRGVPVRATITSFGPLLLAKVLELNATQESSLGLVFHYADGAGLPILDLKDLRAVLTHLTADEGKAELAALGGLSKATAGVILRKLIALGDDGGDAFFGEPEFEVSDLLRTTPDGRGVISALEVPQLLERPTLFSTFLMWLLAELFEELPEVGDLEKPKLVFFFDEAHLLFGGASKAFLASVTQTVRLIRSKGVGIFFVTQNPTDLPSPVLGQLGNRIQHALRAFTPEDADALRKAVRTYPKTKDYDLSADLTALGTGEAFVTVLADNGAPTPVAWTRLRAPRTLMGVIDAAALDSAVAASPLMTAYGMPIDRESAYEKLAARMTASAQPEPQAPSAPAPNAPPRPEAKRSASRTSQPEGVLGNPVIGSFARAAATVLGRELARGLFGNRRRR